MLIGPNSPLPISLSSNLLISITPCVEFVTKISSADFNSSNEKWVMHDDTGFMIDRNVADSEIRSNAHKWSLQDSSRSDLENWLLGEQQWILENIDSVRFSCIICDKFVYLGDVAHIHNSFNKKEYYWEYCFNCATLENNK